MTGDGYERALRHAGLALGPVIALAIGLVYDGAGPAELPALMALCVVWWITEAVPPAVVALVAAAGAVLTGLATPDKAFGAFGKPLLFLFVGSFFIAEAIKRHGLGERIARAMTGVARTQTSLLVTVALTAFLLSMVMSNSASTAIVLPLVLPIAAASADRRFSTALILCVAWGASVGGIATPVGTPPNLIGLNALRERGHDLSFVDWMAVGVPIGLVMIVGMLLSMRLLLRYPGGALPPVDGTAHRAWTPGEYSALIAVCLALTGWLLPTLVDDPWLDKHLTEDVVAIIAGCSLFLLPAGNRRPALLWSEATQIDWGVILMFGGGVLLGELAKEHGLSKELGHALVDATGASSTWAICALCTATAIVLSELTSNTATATLMAPLAGELATAAGAAPVPAILGATLGSSFGFMLPISTAPNAMAYATGRVKVRDMARTGIVFDVVGFALIVLGLRLLCPLLGMA